MFNKKIYIYLLVAAMALTAFISGCGQTKDAEKTGAAQQQTSKEQGKRYTWKMFSYLPSTHFYPNDVFKPFAKEIFEKTNGQLDIKISVVGELPYKGSELLSAIKSRQIEMAEIQPTFEIGEMPELATLQYPFLTRSYDDQVKIVKALNPDYEQILNKKFNAHWLMDGAYPPLQLITNKPLKDISGAKGLRIRTVGSHYSEAIGTLGGSGVAMTTGEVYTALQRGTVDGVETSYLTQYSSKFHEVANNTIEWNDTVNSDIIIVNLDVWNELPEPTRKIVEKVADKYNTMWHDLVAKKDAEAKQKMLDAGGQVIAISAADNEQITNNAKPLWEKWAKQFEGGEPMLQKALGALNK